MSYGIEIFDASGNRTLGMQDFTYTKIFEIDIPGAGGGTGEAVYPVTVPGYSDSNCVVIFNPLVYEQGEQDGGILEGFVPVYRSLGGEVVGVVRRGQAQYFDTANQRFVTYYTPSVASRMQVLRFSGG